MVRDKIRALVELTLPGAAQLYRQVRTDLRRARLHAVDTPLGFRFAGDDRMAAGTFEPGETAFLSKALETADVFIDAGANLGLYTCLARAAGKSVVAFEPSPENLPVLMFNLAANGWDDVEVYPVALSDHPGTAKLYGGGTGASLVAGWANSSEAYASVVPQVTLDGLMASRFPGKKLLIKVDVEGGEFAALKGALETMSREPAPRWLVEITSEQHHPDGHNPNFGRTFSLFLDRGFHALTIAGTPVDPSAVPPGEINFVFEK